MDRFPRLLDFRGCEIHEGFLFSSGLLEFLESLISRVTRVSGFPEGRGFRGLLVPMGCLGGRGKGVVARSSETTSLL